MNQQEIKEKIKPPFSIDEDFDVVDSYSRLVVDGGLTNSVNLHATTRAINNTYGKGINPESVPEMYSALQLIELNLMGAIDDVVTAKIIRDILKKAAL